MIGTCRWCRVRRIPTRSCKGGRGRGRHAAIGLLRRTEGVSNRSEGQNQSGAHQKNQPWAVTSWGQEQDCFVGRISTGALMLVGKARRGWAEIGGGIEGIAVYRLSVV